MNNRRLTVEELETLPRLLWNLELVRIQREAERQQNLTVIADASEMRRMPDITAGQVVELRERLNVEPVPQAA